MQNANEVPVIFRASGDKLMALLPSLPLQGIPSAILAYTAEQGFFTSDTSVMYSTSSAEHLNVWPLLELLVQKKGIRPIRVAKKITASMTEARLNRQEESYYVCA